MALNQEDLFQLRRAVLTNFVDVTASLLPRSRDSFRATGDYDEGNFVESRVSVASDGTFEHFARYSGK